MTSQTTTTTTTQRHKCPKCQMTWVSGGYLSIEQITQGITSHLKNSH